MQFGKPYLFFGLKDKYPLLIINLIKKLDEYLRS